MRVNFLSLSHPKVVFPSVQVSTELPSSINKPLKHPYIPALSDYNSSPDASFWSGFPSRPLPLVAESKVNVRNLQKMLIKTERK